MSGSLVIGDWGNTRLRLWRLENGAVAERREGPGMVHTADPRGALPALLEDWSAEQVILCGMAGARNGLHETPYVSCPTDVAAWSDQVARFNLDGRKITIAPGVAEAKDRGGRDVMRGEETQIFGAIAHDPRLATGHHLFVLPGTHSKWVRVEDGQIIGFNTHMTGELFALLETSTLCMAAGEATNDDDDDEGFSAGLARSADGAVLTAGLFEGRAAQLLDGKSPGWARGFVSGLLIGAETRAQTVSGPTAVVMIGEPGLTARYKDALAHWDVKGTVLDGEQCAIAGLRLLYADD
uniref:2-dehydro-3-deoxygalactonokinase n=1 Tax=Altererythrobacter segetis TaxID=1104773 RepID=UPI00140E590D|nr:2-dehydro-3-deoxygalactonokinase [Altererythrobacter segetis]